MRRIGIKNVHLNPAVQPATEVLGAGLRPAEIAYLSRNGDVTHSLTVLAADLVQRALKSGSPTSIPPTTEYEKKMWGLARTSVNDWLQNKSKTYLPGGVDSFKKNPVVYAKKAQSVYKFFTVTVREFLKKVAHDPKHIRKYFSFTGIMRLLADFTTAGYQNAFAEEMKSDLAKRGLLVPESTRVTSGFIIWAIALANSIATIYFCSSAPSAVPMLALAAVNAIILQGILLLLSLLPLYSDLVEVMAQIQRTGWRLKLVQFVLRSFRLVYLSIMALWVLITTTATALIFHVLNHADILSSFSVGAIATFSFLITLNLAFTGWELTQDDEPTALAQQELAKVRKRLSAESPLENFTKMIQSADYEPTFSELLAIYGIEFLLMLV